ncbi:precorrin-2 C(20)-methyltransferase [Curvivirga sp.]|uniref:precorrin-2 C(20)-methyltransferase n=1 Tax=Curvivirga sp. TaxID=2856848 RepID=UPI003B590BE6
MTKVIKNTGTLFGVGVGPGDPELITLKALRVIREVDVLAWPALLEGDSLARTIAEPHLDGHHHEIPIRMPMEVARFPAQNVYDKAAVEIAEQLNAGKDVAVLCEGDPFFYGSFMYLFGRLADEFPIQVIPGVSSLMATAAAVGAPLASRNDVMTVIPGPVEEDIMKRRLDRAEAAAIMKVGRHLPKIRRVIEELGLTDQARYISHATMDKQIVAPLAEVELETAPYFSMILIHKRGEAWKEE